ncbi:MAG: hypothetical protein GXY50_11340 [Syntrophomonadaceae bacterium]|nr:hypothetical protein [Syntrophomonadaceae bacterium]
MDTYYLLLKYIRSYPKVRIELGDMVNFLRQRDYRLRTKIDQPEGYEELYKAIDRLIQDKIIKPVNPRKKTHFNPPLALKYAIVKEDAEDYTETKREIAHLNPAFDLQFYLSNPQIYQKDKESIRIIEQYLSHEEKPLLSINELSYQLFDDEKYFKGRQDSPGERILKNLGVSYEDLNCYYAYEPFIHHQFRKNPQDPFVGLIIENKDTYWSFVRLLSSCSTILKINLLIYGEGKKIISSLRYLELLNLKAEKLLYFGDIDCEGIGIYHKLVETYPSLNLQLFQSGYENLIKHTAHKSPRKTPKSQKYREQDVHSFCLHFDKVYANVIRDLLSKGLYLPQEGFSLAYMIEEYGAAHV